VLAATGIVMPLAMLAILFAGNLGLPAYGIAAAAVLAGSFTPPVTVVVRTAWRHRFDDEASRRMAFAFDGTLLEIAYTAGPALIAIAVAVATTQAAMALAWLCAAAAVPMLQASGGLSGGGGNRRRNAGCRPAATPPRCPVRGDVLPAMAFGASIGFPVSRRRGSTPWVPS
jgi:hypothetical protein